MIRMAYFMYNLAMTARPELAAYNWETPPPFPRVRTAVFEFTDTTIDSSRRLIGDNWLVDFAYVDGSKYRTLPMGKHWRPRKPRTVHLYPPRMSFWEHMPPPWDRVRGHIFFEDTPPPKLRALIMPKFGHAQFEDKQARVGRLIEEIAQVGALRRDDGFWEAQSLLCRIIDMLLGAIHVEGPLYRIGRPTAAAPTLATRVDQYLRDNLSRRITLADVARHVSVSVSTLSHRYPAEAGRSVMQTLLDIRLTTAKGLLERGDPLKTVAAQLGFTDAFHFSHAFKRGVGIPPRAFRRQTRRK